MKNFPIYILILLSTLVFAQTPNKLNWNYNDFIKNDVKKVSSYSIQLRKNGKIKRRDSTLLFVKEVDLDNNIVFGINSNLVFVTHVGSHLTWNKFKGYYNKSGLILKETSLPLEINKTNEFGIVEYDESQGETIYEYDTRVNLVRKEYRTVNNHYSIYKSSKDTFHLKSIDRPKIYEYLYNSDNQKLKQFHTVDSTRYLKTKSYNPDNRTDAVTCSYCDPKYLYIEWKYDDKKRLVEWISYTRKNELHTKRYYFYDEENRLKNQIDSTGWYIYKKPIWESTKTYEYGLDNTTETINNNTETRFGSYYKKEITVYDSNNNIISECKVTDDRKECTNYAYKWDEGKLVEKTVTNSDGQIITEKLEYNNRKLINEKSEYRNGKRIELIRYYYE